MIVKLRGNWFAPAEDPRSRSDGTVITGRRYRKGDVEMDDWLFPYLPKDAIIIEAPDEGLVKERKSVEEYGDFRNYDMERAASEEAQKIAEKAEIQRLRVEQMNEAKARKRAAEQNKE